MEWTWGALGGQHVVEQQQGGGASYGEWMNRKHGERDEAGEVA